MLVPDLSQTGAVYLSEKSNRDMESSHANILICMCFISTSDFLFLNRDCPELKISG